MNPAVEEARQIVLEKVSHYNQILSLLSSLFFQAIIFVTISFSITFLAIALRLAESSVPLILLSNTITSFLLLVGTFFADEEISAKNIFLQPSRAAFFSSLQGGKPIILKPLIKKEELWTTLVSQLPEQSEKSVNVIRDELIIKTIFALKINSIDLYNLKSA